MNEPDKIYVLPEFASVVKVLDEEVEYIRKDALLEWAKEEKSKCSDESHPYVQFMNVVINKLNSL